MKKALLPLFTLVVFFSLFASCKKQDEKTQQIISLIRQVNDRWQETHPDHANAFWHPAAYHIGNLEVYQTIGEERYKQYSQQWAEKNKWQGARSNDTLQWKYSYGERDDYVLFGDWQTCFQVYVDLYKLEGCTDRQKLARAMEVMEYQMSTPNNDYWWWADGLFMVMPVMTKLYNVTGNGLYLEKLYEYFSFARNLMHDPQSGLFYRDGKYIYPEHQTANGSKDFWARGNGWVFAALAKVLQELPQDDPHREEYVRIYQQMAEAIAASQQEPGYWTRSMIDPEHAPGPETSGTAFFAYGYLWGVNNGYLDKKRYDQTIRKSWEYLVDFAVQQDGTVGYVQPIGERAIPGQTLGADSTADFGVGAFLMAACEMIRYQS